MMTHRVEPGLTRGAVSESEYGVAQPQTPSSPQFEWQQAPLADGGLHPDIQAQMQAQTAAAQPQAAWLQNQPRVDYVPQSDMAHAGAAAPHYARETASAAGHSAAAGHNAYLGAPQTIGEQAPVATATGYHDPNAYAAAPMAVAPAALPKLGPAQWIGAGLSFALIIGLGVWATQLMMRDVRGVPVIRALEGQARLVPEDPGGQLAMHQGLAVNSVTADGSAAAPADRLTLAPRPTALTDEDQPVGFEQPTLTAYQPQTDAYDIQSAEPEIETAQPVLGDLEQVDVITDPLELASIATEDAVKEDEAPRGVAIPVDPNIYASPRPKARPRQLASLSATPVTPSPAAQQGSDLNDIASQMMAAVGEAGEIKVGDVPVGARLVQFSAFHSQDIARKEWDRLAGKFGELLEDKVRVIEEAQSGGKTFYRLRAYGFADSEDSNRFCAAVTAMNEQCVPTIKR